MICTGTQLQLHGTASSYDSLRWITHGDGTFTNDTILNPVYTPGAGDVSSGSVKLRLTATGANGCFASVLNLAINPVPVVHLSVLPGDTLCGGQTAHLSVDTIQGGHYLWTPGGFTAPDINVDTSLTHGFGSGWFRARITNSGNCSSSDSVRVTFKDCSGIAESTAGPDYEIYPNPNDGTFTLKTRNRSGQMTIRLLNALNIVVFEDKDIEVTKGFSRTYNLPDLPAGIYILKMEDRDGKNNMKMIVK